MNNPKIVAKQLASILAAMQATGQGAAISADKDQGKDVKDQKDNKDAPDQQKDNKDNKDISDKQVQDKSLNDSFSTTSPFLASTGNQAMLTNALLARLVSAGSTGSFISASMRPDLMTSQLMAEEDMTVDEISELKENIVSLLDAAISESDK